MPVCDEGALAGCDGTFATLLSDACPPRRARLMHVSQRQQRRAYQDGRQWNAGEYQQLPTHVLALPQHPTMSLVVLGDDLGTVLFTHTHFFFINQLKRYDHRAKQVQALHPRRGVRRHREGRHVGRKVGVGVKGAMQQIGRQPRGRWYVVEEGGLLAGRRAAGSLLMRGVVRLFVLTTQTQHPSISPMLHA